MSEAKFNKKVKLEFDEKRGGKEAEEGTTLGFMASPVFFFVIHKHIFIVLSVPV